MSPPVYYILEQIVKSSFLPCLLGLCFLFLWGWKEIYLDRKKNLLHVPGPTPLPLIGNAHFFYGPPEAFMSKVTEMFHKYSVNKAVRFHLGNRVNLAIANPDLYEKILSNNKHNTKGQDYRFLWDWLGMGLLTSTGSKWHSRRKMLTPAFHFRILEDFMQVMIQQSDIFCKQLEKRCDGKSFNIFPLVTHCALDIICETAMGKSINAQEDSDTEYVKAVYRSSDIVFKRQTSPWLWSDWLFKYTPLGREFDECLKILHGFTNAVIQERKEELRNVHNHEEEDDVGRKKRMAFLDLLIKESKGGTVLSDEDIREEVDTFMFEGHDTTATNMTFTLFLLAAHADVQKKCQEEQDEIFMGSDRPATSADLVNMKYLESCLKESLRLYQSVPIMSRTTGEEMEVNGHIIPANTNVILVNYLLHRDPETFPDPDTFNPERFNVSINQKRHPYSYLPFSAGPRNCIGQKFAAMEEKLLVSSVLRKFNLKCETKMEDIPLVAEVILRPKDGIHLTVSKRDS